MRDYRDARRSIQEQQQPQRPPLPGLQRVSESVVRCCTLFGLGGGRNPARRLPPNRWVLHEVAGRHGNHKICDAKIGECLQDANILNQASSQRCEDQSPGAKTADGDAGDKASAIRKPLNQYRYGNNVTESNSYSSDEPVAQVEPPKLVSGEACQEDTQAVEKSASERDDARSFPVQPEASEESCNSQHKDRDREGKRYFLYGPMKSLCEGNSENAPCIHGSQSHLHQESRCRDSPAIRVCSGFCHLQLPRSLI